MICKGILSCPVFSHKTGGAFFIELQIGPIVVCKRIQMIVSVYSTGLMGRCSDICNRKSVIADKTTISIF